MRIVFLTWKDVAHPLAGGSEILVDRLAAGLHERGHEVTVLSGAPVGEHPYRVIDAGGKYVQYVRSPVLTRARVGPHDVLVDVCNGVPFFSPLWSSVPVVALVNHIHFGMWREWFSPGVAWVGSTIETRLMPRLYRGRRVVAVSRSTADALTSLGLPSDQVTVVHNGVDVDPAATAERSVRAREPTFTAIGRLVPHKRFDLMLRAWRDVRAELGAGRLHVVGAGPLRADLERGAPPGTVFHGRITDAERDALLARSWALIQPSRLEGWGLVVMEAAAQATPTIGFRVPGTQDSVVDGASGVLVDTEDELVARWVELATDEEQRHLLSKQALDRAKGFGWDRTVETFEAALLDTVADASDRPRAGRGGRRADWNERLELFRLFRAEKHDPEPFSRALAARSIRELPFDLAGARVLDLGCGRAHSTELLREAGATVTAVDIDPELLDRTGAGLVLGDGRRLPFPDRAFDGIYCSNLLEHTPDAAPILAEVGRVLRPGGWSWVSWTNWYSPWGGHEIVPFHYLGPDLGLRVWRRLFGEPRKNVPFDGLWPMHIGNVLRAVDAEPSLERRDAHPRYWRGQRWILSVPGLRELITWNCVLVLERTIEPAPPAVDRTSPRALVRRGLRRARRVLGNDPRWLPIVLRATPLGTSRRLGPDVDLVIEGFPRSGNTFAHFATALAEPSLHVVSRVHTPSQVKQAVRLGLPTLVVVRDPVDAVASLAVAAPHVPLRSLLAEYVTHHEQLLALADHVVVATFEQVTTDFDRVLDGLRERFGLSIGPFDHRPQRVGEVFEAIEREHRRAWRDERANLPVPAATRAGRTREVRDQLGGKAYAAMVAEARTAYDALAAKRVGREA